MLSYNLNRWTVVSLDQNQKGSYFIVHSGKLLLLEHSRASALHPWSMDMIGSPVRISSTVCAAYATTHTGRNWNWTDWQASGRKPEKRAAQRVPSATVKLGRKWWTTGSGRGKKGETTDQHTTSSTGGPPALTKCSVRVKRWRGVRRPSPRRMTCRAGLVWFVCGVG
jgi:hypothetical protein